MARLTDSDGTHFQNGLSSGPPLELETNEGSRRFHTFNLQIMYMNIYQIKISTHILISINDPESMLEGRHLILSANCTDPFISEHDKK